MTPTSSLRPPFLAAFCVALSVLASLAQPSGAGANNLSTRGFGPGIEGLPSYDGQDKCSPTPKPGVLAFRQMVLAAFPGTGPGGIERDCSIGGQSEHKEGRAWDWMVNASVPEQKAAADAVTHWLTKPDRFGNDAAMARRLGVMYMIFNRKIWFPGSGWRVYCKQKDFGCHVPGDKKSLRHPHTDHVHFSFTWDGAKGRTTYWKKKRSFLSAAATPHSGSGYWLLARTGGVAAVGSHHLGSGSGSRKSAVAMAAHPLKDGYWLLASNGRVTAFGGAAHFGAAKGKSKKFVSIEATPTGKGYWMLTRRGRLFAFGDAQDLGTVATGILVAGMQTTPTGAGYWVAALDGVVHAFGDAADLGDLKGAGPVAGIEGDGGGGYWLFTPDGVVTPFGSAPRVGDLSDQTSTQEIVAMTPTSTGGGYWLVGAKGKVSSFGDAPAPGGLRSLSSMHRPVPTEDDLYPHH